MRLYHLTMLFVLIAIGLTVTTETKINELSAIAKDAILIKNSLDRAADAAADKLAYMGAGGAEYIADAAQKNFNAALAGGFGQIGLRTEAMQFGTLLIVGSRVESFYHERVGMTTEGEYVRESGAAAEIRPAELFYINETGEGYASSKYYHTEKCRLRAEYSCCYGSRRECALAGAYECPECGGEGR